MNDARPEISLNFSDCPVHLEDYLAGVLARKYRVRRADRPDFLIYGVTGQRHRLYTCVKILTHHETWPTDWRECDYAILPFWHEDPRHFYLPIFAYNRSAAPLLRPPLEGGAIQREKTRFCALLSSYADRSVRPRIRFFQELNRRQKVDSLGRALNNTGFQVPPGHPPKLEALRPYRFTIAFENKCLAGWTTEKMYDPLVVHSVPIFWGDPIASRWFNPAAFINAHDFARDSELADFVRELDRDPGHYLQYLQAPPFRNNQPPEVFAEDRLLSFFDRIFQTPLVPVARRRWFFPLTKWRLAKRHKLPGQ